MAAARCDRGSKQGVEELSEEEIGYQNEDRGVDDGVGRRAPDPVGAALRVEPIVAPDNCDEIGEEEGLSDTAADVGEQQRIKIPSGSYSLLATIADIQGLNDDLADPSAVFLIRAPRSGPGTKPVVFRMDSRDPVHLAAAARFQVVDGDIVHVSNASFAQTKKFLDAIAPVLTAVGIATP